MVGGGGCNQNFGLEDDENEENFSVGGNCCCFYHFGCNLLIAFLHFLVSFSNLNLFKVKIFVVRVLLQMNPTYYEY